MELLKAFAVLCSQFGFSFETVFPFEVRVKHRHVIVCLKKPNYPLSRVTYTSHSLFDNINFMCSLKESPGMDWAMQERKD